MASRLYKQFLFSLNPMLSYLEGNFAVGNSGAVSAVKGGGISNVVRLAAGQYQIVLEDPYNRFLGMNAWIASPSAGSALTATASGTVYIINALGTATTAQWVAVGLAVGVTPAVGVAFKASATATIGGSATVKVAGVSGMQSIEMVGDPNLTLNPAPGSSPYLVMQCMSATSSSVTTNVAADPASGSKLGFQIMLRNSSLKGKGE